MLGPNDELHLVCVALPIPYPVRSYCSELLAVAPISIACWVSWCSTWCAWQASCQRCYRSNGNPLFFPLILSPSQVSAFTDNHLPQPDVAGWRRRQQASLSHAEALTRRSLRGALAAPQPAAAGAAPPQVSACNASLCLSKGGEQIILRAPLAALLSRC